MKNVESENKFVDKSSAHGMFQFDKDGVLRIGGVVANMTPMASIAIQYHLMSKYLDKNKLDDIIYYIGNIQGSVAIKILRDKFGIKSVKEMFFTSLDQLGMMGLGKNEVVRFNEKERQVILKRQVSPFEDIYIKIFGHQKDAIGHFNRGGVAGMLSELFGEEMVVVEKQCKVQNKEYCLEEAFPRKLIETKELSMQEKEQIPAPEDSFPEIVKFKNVLIYLK